MSLYKEFAEQLNELNIADLVQGLQQEKPGCSCGGKCGGHGPIQPDSDVGSFGNQPNVEEVEISQTDDGSVKVKSGSLCVKLSPCVLKALKHFMETQGEDNANQV